MEGCGEVPTEDLPPSPARSLGAEEARGAGAPSRFSENRAAGGLACTFAELGTFFFQLRVTMFPSGWRLPLPGESGLVSSPRTSCYSQQPTGFPITDELTGVARGCGIKDGRRRKPTANFLKTPRCQGSEHPPRVTHAPPPDTLTHTHTHFTQNHSTGEQRVFTQC